MTNLISILKISLNRGRISFFTISLLIITFGLSQPGAGLMINEFLASNGSVNLDPDFQNFADWIEIRNTSDLEIELLGFTLTDNLTEPDKWHFPEELALAPEDILILWADGQDTVATDLHVNFKLNAGGEELGLFNAEGVLLDVIIFPEQYPDISSGRSPEIPAEWLYYGDPSPGSDNGDLGIAEPLFCQPPMFSIPPGIYFGTQSVELTTQYDEGEIRFTVDGSRPTPQSQIGENSIIFDTTMVVRARVYHDGLLPSKVETATYIIDEPFALPVVSIAIDPDYLWHEDIGIYVEGSHFNPDECETANYFQDWERPCHFEYFSPDGNRNLNFDAGLEILGKSTPRYPQKSLGLSLRSSYSQDSFDYDIFDGKNLYEQRYLVLRNGGGDWRKSMISDPLVHSLSAGMMDLDFQSYQPAVVFLNGEYWGIHNIREKMNRYFPEANFNLDPDLIQLLEQLPDNIIEGEAADYQALLDYIEVNDLSDPTHYEYVQSQIDTEEYINYLCTEIFCANRDWPQNNVKWWRISEPAGPWRWMLFDTDAGLGQMEDNSLSLATELGVKPPWSTALVRGLLTSPVFADRFITRLVSHLNTTYHTDRVTAFIDSLVTNLEPEMPRHLDRWGDECFINYQTGVELCGIGDMADWYENLTGKYDFAAGRPAVVFQNLQDRFDLEDPLNLQLSVVPAGSGRIRVDGQKIPNDTFSGQFFSGFTWELTAEPSPGYRFLHWTGTVNSDSCALAYSPDAAGAIQAVFEPLTSPLLVINEINYHSSDDFDTGDWIELYNPHNQELPLAGWSLNDEGGTAPYTFAESASISAHGYVVVCVDSEAFSEFFPAITPEEGNLAFGLSAGGDRVTLLDADDALIDQVVYNDAIPWPLAADGSGPTLELLHPSLDNALPENWRASPALGGSPGMENNLNSPPYFNSQPVEMISEGQFYSYNISCIDPDGDPVQLVPVTIPDWLTYTNTGSYSALLEGFASPGMIENQFPVSISVSDSIFTILQDFVLAVQFQQDNWYVSEDGSDDNLGLQPDNALATIETAFLSATATDTVFVLPGIYYEQVNFQGKGVVLSSLYTITKDPEYIQTTVLDGSNEGTVVVMNSGEESSAVLTGFTIRNGSGSEWIISGNEHNAGGGVFIDHSAPRLENLIIENNSSPEWGGGLALINSNSILTNVDIRTNTANLGGGLFCMNSDMVIAGSTIYGNIAQTSGGGVRIIESDLSFRHTVFAENSAISSGGALGLSNSAVLLGNSTLVQNESPLGPAVHLKNTSVILAVNTISWLNPLPAIYASSVQGPNSVILSHSDLEGGLGTIFTNGNCAVFLMGSNLDVDPFFSDVDNDDFTLQNESPCIDAGTALFQYDGWEDYQVSTGDYHGEQPDLGAFETGILISGCTSPNALNFNDMAVEDDGSCLFSGDFDLNGSVDVRDIVLILEYILDELEYDAWQSLTGDLNQDGLLDIQDVVMVVDNIMNS